MRAGPAKALLERLIGHVPLNNKYFDAISWHRVSFCTNQPLRCHPVLFLFCKDIWPIQKTIKKRKWPYLVWKQKLKRDGSEYTCMCVSNTWWKFQSEKCKIERGIVDKPFFRNYLIYIWNSVFGDISLWMTNWTMKLIWMFSLYLQHCLHQNSPWSETTISLRISFG